jgi:hypothetical protein
MTKNKYKVKKVCNGKLVKHSDHKNFDYAKIQRDLMRKKGLSSWIEYRGAVVEKDVKKAMKEGVDI